MQFMSCVNCVFNIAKFLNLAIATDFIRKMKDTFKYLKYLLKLNFGCI